MYKKGPLYYCAVTILLILLLLVANQANNAPTKKRPFRRQTHTQKNNQTQPMHPSLHTSIV